MFHLDPNYEFYPSLKLDNFCRTYRSIIDLVQEPVSFMLVMGSYKHFLLTCWPLK